MERFSIDESGYTGRDLLNPDQRFQGATAISVTEEMAAHLIEQHFPRLQASELKYRSLARRPANRGRLISLQRDILSQCKRVTYICDKRFLLILMFLDYTAEPFYYERGLNFYENGQNYSLASLLYHVGPTLLGGAEFNTLLKNMKNRDGKNRDSPLFPRERDYENGFRNRHLRRRQRPRRGAAGS